MIKPTVVMLAMMWLAGCDKYEGYTVLDARKSAVAACEDFNGRNTAIEIDQFASKYAIKATCVNVGTGNTFYLYIDGNKRVW